jgi:hypothetical protein
MAKIVNLKSARKKRERAAKEGKASVNRAKHGTSKQEKDLETARKALRDRYLDALKKDEP